MAEKRHEKVSINFKGGLVSPEDARDQVDLISLKFQQGFSFGVTLGWWWVLQKETLEIIGSVFYMLFLLPAKKH